VLDGHTVREGDVLTKQAIQEWAIQGIEEIRTTNPSLGWPPADEHTVLIGTASLLDSLDLSTLIAHIENKIADVTGKDYVLQADDAMRVQKSREVTVNDLAEFVINLVDTTSRR
jgi:hypothetical protein